jgi:predicted MFS family arabinose efflux permease
MAFVLLFFLFLCFEFSIVTAMALSTEILQDARAAMMSGFLFAASLGRICGTFLGTGIWSSGGMKVIGPVSTLCCGLAFISLLIGLRKIET